MIHGSYGAGACCRGQHVLHLRDWSISMHSFIHASSSTLGRARLVLTLVALIAMARVASATQILSTFDTDLDGWTSSAGGSMTFATTGGNPGGFLRDLDL